MFSRTLKRFIISPKVLPSKAVSHTFFELAKKHIVRARGKKRKRNLSERVDEIVY